MVIISSVATTCFCLFLIQVIFIQRVIGSDCKVEDPLNHIVFDLSPLRKQETSNWQVTAGEYVFLLNVCDQLNSAPPSCQGAASCQTKSNGMFSVDAG